MHEAEKLPQAHLILMGVCGSGKTTIAEILAQRSGFELVEADEFHPAENVEKMSKGQPLTDEDRWPWLEKLSNWLQKQDSAGKRTVVTCSALKRIYRDKLRLADVPLIFVHLDGPRELLLKRLSHRTDHFMPASMLDSQLDTLESLQPDELGFAVDIDDTSEGIAATIMERLNAVA